MTDVKKLTVKKDDDIGQVNRAVHDEFGGYPSAGQMAHGMSDEDWLETTARIAGNIASGLVQYDPESGLYESGRHEANVAETAVSLARAIVKELRGVESGSASDRASERRRDGQTGPS